MYCNVQGSILSPIVVLLDNAVNSSDFGKEKLFINLQNLVKLNQKLNNNQVTIVKLYRVHDVGKIKFIANRKSTCCNLKIHTLCIRVQSCTQLSAIKGLLRD